MADAEKCGCQRSGERREEINFAFISEASVVSVSSAVANGRKGIAIIQQIIVYVKLLLIIDGFASPVDVVRAN